jgi:hypothetical protein
MSIRATPSEIDHDPLRARARLRARRAAQVVTLSLALGGCYLQHGIAVDDTGDAGSRLDSGTGPDAGMRVDAGRRDAGPADAAVCSPDPDCYGPGVDDGICDWDQWEECCVLLSYIPSECHLPGGPLAPPEMHA